MIQEIPIWVQPIKGNDWQTQVIDNAQLKYILSVPSAWHISPKVLSTHLDIEHFFQGNVLGEGLVIKFMQNANPKHNILNWVEAFVSLMGFPILSIRQTLEPLPQLIQWEYKGICPPLSERLKVDEIHLYEGLAQISESSPTLIRLYILLARRNTFAWQINLSISSACLPDAPKELVEINDHFRAGAIFGNLQFL
jgi:hypothetical protein